MWDFVTWTSCLFVLSICLLLCVLLTSVLPRKSVCFACMVVFLHSYESSYIFSNFHQKFWSCLTSWCLCGACFDTKVTMSELLVFSRILVPQNVSPSMFLYSSMLKNTKMNLRTKLIAWLSSKFIKKALKWVNCMLEEVWEHPKDNLWLPNYSYYIYLSKKYFGCVQVAFFRSRTLWLSWKRHNETAG